MTKKFVFDDQKECSDEYEKNKFTISNLKYKYNHFHYHVGDFDQLRQEINKINPPKLKYKMNKKNSFHKNFQNKNIIENINKNKKFCSPFLTSSHYRDKLFKFLKKYMIYFKQGIFVSIRNNEPRIVPMVYYNYKNKFYFKKNKKLNYQYTLNPDEWYIDGCYIRMSIRSKKKPTEWDVSQYFYFIQQLCKHRKISDIDFIINNTDFPVLNKKINFFQDGFLPVLSTSGHNNFYDLHLPSVDSIEFFYKKYFLNAGSKTTCIKRFEKSYKKVKWDDKINTIFFRGSTTGCEIGMKNHRIKTLVYSKNKKNKLSKYMDVEVDPNGTQIYRLTKDKKYVNIRRNLYPFKKDFVPFDNWTKYKYHLNLEGWVAAERFLRLLSLGSCVINLKSEYTLWFEQFTEKDKYYIEVNNLDELEKKFFKLHKNQSKVKKIATEGKKYVNKLLSKKILYDYMEFLLNNIVCY